MSFSAEEGRRAREFYSRYQHIPFSTKILGTVLGGELAVPSTRNPL